MRSQEHRKATSSSASGKLPTRKTIGTAYTYVRDRDERERKTSSCPWDAYGFAWSRSERVNDLPSSFSPVLFHIYFILAWLEYHDNTPEGIKCKCMRISSSIRCFSRYEFSCQNYDISIRYFPKFSAWWNIKALLWGIYGVIADYIRLPHVPFFLPTWCTTSSFLLFHNKKHNHASHRPFNSAKLKSLLSLS